MIIVEGLDNTGKTTLVERIKSDFPQLTMMPSIGNKHDLEQIYKQAWGAIDGDKKDPLVLWDRSRFISEYIYNPVIKGRKCAFDLTEWMMMLGQYVKHPQLLIYCRRSLPKIVTTFDEREQLGGVYENLEDLYASYETVMEFIRYLFFVTGEHASTDNGVGAYSFDFDFQNYEDHVKPLVEKYVRRFS